MVLRRGTRDYKGLENTPVGHDAWRGRSEFVAAGVAGFAAFSLLGLFSALPPTFLRGLLHVHSHALEGAVVFIMFAVGTVTQLLLSRFGSRRVTANRLAPAERRGQTIYTYFVVCYCGLIVPVVGVGVASEFFADFAAVVAFSILLAALCVLSLIRIPWDLSQGSAAA